jgi:hypothetical protein
MQVLAVVPEISQVVFRSSFAFRLGGVFQESFCRSHNVEGDVGKGQIFFQERAVACPFT